MAAYDPAQWHGFCTSFASASGALLGLVFVAVSLNLEPILASNELPHRAIETLIFFAYPLAGSLLVQVPGLSATGVGIGEGVLAAGFVGLAVADIPHWRRQRADPLSWRLTHLAPGVLIASLAVVGSFATLTTSIGVLYWLAAAMVVGAISGLVNSWVLLAEIKR